MCIPRKIMPQIDLADMDGLLDYLRSHGVDSREATLPIGLLTMKQCVGDTRPARNQLLKQKPLLIASDYSVLDGNGRYLMWKKEGQTKVPCIYLSKPFMFSALAILAFPKAYRYADGPQPYRI